MGKGIVVACMLAIMLSETAADVYDLYGITKITDVEVLQTEVDDLQAEYDRLTRDVAFDEQYNESLDLYETPEINERVAEREDKLAELEKLLLEAIDEPLDVIMSYDNDYQQVKSELDSMILDPVEFEPVDIPYEEISELKAKLEDKKRALAYAEQFSDIGTVIGVVQPVQAPMKIGEEFSDTHDGVDLEANIATGVVSVIAGTVIYADYDENYGETVRIDSGEGIILEYRHLYERYVQVGYTVRQYEKIGTIGANLDEGDKPYHLHLSVYINDKAYDPLLLINQREVKDNDESEDD